MQEGYVRINGQMVKKPTKGRCAYCGSDMLEFYDDGSGICLNCGRTFSWLNPLKEPVNPQVKRAAAAPAVAAASRTPPKQSRPAPAETFAPVKKSGILGAKAISVLGLLGALFISIGAMILIATLPAGSWPPDDFSRDTLGDINKAGMLIWSLGTMFFLMAGFSAAATEEMDAGVRKTLIASSVALAILSFSIWIGMKMFGF